MTPATPPPSGRGPSDRARLANALRVARHAKALGGVEAGRRAGMSQSKVSKLERGFLLPSLDDVRALSRVYDIDAKERDELLELTAGLREESSAKIILARNVAETQRRIGRMEASATLLRGFQPAMVLGLLQSIAYRQVVFGVPAARDLPTDEVERAHVARDERQAVLDDTSKRFVLIMTEGALRWHAGSAEIMAEQVDAIAAATRRGPNVRIGIIPWTTPVRHFPRHGFHIYDEDAVTAATETATATLTGAADVATYVELFDALETAASFDDEAREHLRRIADDYRRLMDR